MLDLRIGARVVHPQHGLGTVTEVGDEYMAVRFDDGVEALLRVDAHPLIPAPDTRAEAGGSEPPAAGTGERPWPDSTFALEEPGTVHSLGSHWQPFVDRADDIMRRLPELAAAWLPRDGFGSIGPGRNAPRDVPPDWPRGWHFGCPPPNRGLTATVRFERPANRLVTLYPACELGSQHTITLDKVTVWEDGCTAQISASIGGAEVVFFDTAYLINRPWYYAGKEYDFILAGIAYSAGPAETSEIRVTLPAEVESWLSDMAEESGEESSREKRRSFSLRGAAGFLPVPEWDCDDYGFRAPVKSVKEVRDFLGQDGWRVRATVLRDALRPDDATEDVDLDILITRKAWEGAEAPKAGQDIEGTLWLQGYLWFPHGYGSIDS